MKPPGRLRLLNSLLALLPFRQRVWPLHPPALLERSAGRENTNFGFTHWPTAAWNLAALVSSLEKEAGLTPMGELVMFESLRDRLRARALVERTIRAHGKEIAAQRISKPLVIVGLPRTGTTFLHRLLSQDPRFRPLLYYEGHSPALPPPYFPQHGEEDPRCAECERRRWLSLCVPPSFKAIHESRADLPEEEILLLSKTFWSMLDSCQAYVPSYNRLRQSDSFDARARARDAYSYLLLLLKILQWQRWKVFEGSASSFQCIVPFI